MSKALSSAKVQSVREIKKKANIKKINKRITTIVIILVVLVLLGMFFKSYIIDENGLQSLKNIFSNNTFEDEELGIKFYSQDFPVSSALDILEKDTNFNIVYNTNIEDQNYLSNVYQTINTTQSIYSSKGKNVTLIITSLDNSNNLITCATNFGDINRSEQIDSNTCEDLIKRYRTTIIIDYIKPQLEDSTVKINVDEKLIIVNPKSKDDLDRSILLILKAMYSDYEETISKIKYFNDKIKDLNMQT
jgi:hypothetical protein